jgi:hypothetical protein
MQGIGLKCFKTLYVALDNFAHTYPVGVIGL